MFRGALLGFIVALAALLPPILHFLTGPLGPLIGGFFGGSRAGASPTQAVAMGLIMAFLMSVLIAGLMAVGTILTSLLPRIVSDAMTLVGVIIVIYTGVMGSIGAFLGGMLARSSPSKADSANSVGIEE